MRARLSGLSSTTTTVTSLCSMASEFGRSGSGPLPVDRVMTMPWSPGFGTVFAFAKQSKSDNSVHVFWVTSDHRSGGGHRGMWRHAGTAQADTGAVGDDDKEQDVAQLDEALKEAMNITGAVGVALVDFDSGMMLGSAGGGPDL